MRILTILLAALLTGCGGGEAACEGLDEATCEAEGACTPMYGAEDCGAGETVYAGCATAEDVDACDDALTDGGPGDGTCFRFPDSCQPDGFAPCSCGDTGT